MSQSTQLIKANAPLPQVIKTRQALLPQTKSQYDITTMYNARHDTTVPQGARGGSAEPYGFWGKMMRIVFYPILYPIKVLQEKLGGTPDENTSSTNENGMGNDRLETNFKNNPSCFTTIKSTFAWIYNLSRFFASPGSEGRENNEEKHNSGLQIPRSTSLYDKLLDDLQTASTEGERDKYLQKHRNAWEDALKALGAECEQQTEKNNSLWQQCLEYKTQNQELYKEFQKKYKTAEECEQKLLGQYTEFHRILFPE